MNNLGGVEIVCFKKESWFFLFCYICLYIVFSGNGFCLWLKKNGNEFYSIEFKYKWLNDKIRVI